MPGVKEILEVGGTTVLVSNPGKIFFPRTGHTKLDLVRYYLSVAEGALRGTAGRPMVLKRFVHGAEGEAFFQKRAPETRPDWIETVLLSFPSGRTAQEVVIRNGAGLAWVVNLGCIDLNPHAVRTSDLDHPDELRVDLDPVPGVGWPQVLHVAGVARDVLADFGLTGWPKTSGSRGFHIYARIEPRWTFTEVRRAAVALAREIERRAPEAATSRWWKEERHGVFVDYNQNAKDRTVASAYSVRPTADARVSAPLAWPEVAACDPAAFTIDTVPARFARQGDPWQGMDEAVGSLAGLLTLADEHEAAGLADAPWPPHYGKQEREPPRVQPSKRRTDDSGGTGGQTAPAPPAGPHAVPAGSSLPPGTHIAPIEGGLPATLTGRATGSSQAEDRIDATAPVGSPPTVPDESIDRTGPQGRPRQGTGPRRGAGRRRSTMPLIEVARAASEAEARRGLERWKQRHPDVWALLEPADVLVDSMRGRSSTWTRIRLNLRHVPPEQQPPQEPLEVDYDPWQDTSARQRQRPPEHP